MLFMAGKRRAWTETANVDERVPIHRKHCTDRMSSGKVFKSVTVDITATRTDLSAGVVQLYLGIWE